MPSGNMVAAGAPDETAEDLATSAATEGPVGWADGWREVDELKVSAGPDWRSAAGTDGRLAGGNASGDPGRLAAPAAAWAPGAVRAAGAVAPGGGALCGLTGRIGDCDGVRTGGALLGLKVGMGAAGVASARVLAPGWSRGFNAAPSSGSRGGRVGLSGYPTRPSSSRVGGLKLSVVGAFAVGTDATAFDDDDDDDDDEAGEGGARAGSGLRPSRGALNGDSCSTNVFVVTSSPLDALWLTSTMVATLDTIPTGGITVLTMPSTTVPAFVNGASSSGVAYLPSVASVCMCLKASSVFPTGC